MVVTRSQLTSIDRGANDLGKKLTLDESLARVKIGTPYRILYAALTLV